MSQATGRNDAIGILGATPPIDPQSTRRPPGGLYSEPVLEIRS
jgi:hypothetical protein